MVCSSIEASRGERERWGLVMLLVLGGQIILGEVDRTMWMRRRHGLPAS